MRAVWFDLRDGELRPNYWYPSDIGASPSTAISNGRPKVGMARCTAVAKWISSEDRSCVLYLCARMD